MPRGGMFIKGETGSVSPLELAHCSQQPCGMEATRERARTHDGVFSRTVSRMWVCVVGIHRVCVECDLVSPVKLPATPVPFTEGRTCLTQM